MTNYLLILGKPYPNANPGFRGIERHHPSVPGQLDENNPLHHALLWKADHPDLTIQDLEEARRLIKLFAEQNPPEHYELIELTENNSPPFVGYDLLGFDLAIDQNQSLLSRGLKYSQVWKSQDEAQQALTPLLELATRFFEPQLNICGLFDDYALASFCLDCLLALQRFVPGIWDSQAGNYRTVGIWRITDI